MKVEIYSDVACPWCYIGKARFERALSAFPGAGEVEVVYRPYQLDPAAPQEGIPMLEYLERRFGGNARGMADRVSENARSEGLVMDYDRGIAANTLHAHRLMYLALRDHGPETQKATAEAFFRAHFSEGLDIADPEVLVKIAESAGIDGASARAYVGSDEGLAEVRAEIEGARRLGITAVPTFVFEEKYAVQGAQPTSAFLQALETVAAERSAAGVAAQDGVCDEESCEVQS